MNNCTQYHGKLNVIGEKIRDYREAKHWSQQVLSNKLQLIGIDIPKNSLQRVENGNRIIKDYELAGIMKVLGISADEMLRDFINEL